MPSTGVPFANACSSSPGRWPPRPATRLSTIVAVREPSSTTVASISSPSAIVISPVAGSRNSATSIAASALPPTATNAVVAPTEITRPRTTSPGLRCRLRVAEVASLAASSAAKSSSSESVTVPPWLPGSCPEGVEQRPGLDQVGRVEPFPETLIDRCEQIACAGRISGAGPEARQAGGGAEPESRTPATAGDLDGAPQATLGGVRRALAAHECLARHAMQLRFECARAGLLEDSALRVHDGERLGRAACPDVGGGETGPRGAVEVRARAGGGDAAALHRRDALVEPSLLGQGPALYELAPAEPLRKSLLGGDGHERLSQVAGALRLSAELADPGGEEERDAQAEGMGALAREFDHGTCTELGLVGAATDPCRQREVALRDDGWVVPVAQRVAAVTLDVVDPEHVDQVAPRAVGLAVPEPDLAEQPARLHHQRLVAGAASTIEQLLGEAGGPPEPPPLDRDGGETVQRGQQLGRLADLLAQRLRSRIGALGRGRPMPSGGDEDRPEAGLQRQLAAVARLRLPQRREELDRRREVVLGLRVRRPRRGLLGGEVEILGRLLRVAAARVVVRDGTVVRAE